MLGGASFDPNYLKQTFFPEMLDELITQKLSEDKGDLLAMMVYPSSTNYPGITRKCGARRRTRLARHFGRDGAEGKPEVSRNLG